MDEPDDWRECTVMFCCIGDVGVTRFTERKYMRIVSLEVQAKQMNSVCVRFFFSFYTVAFLVGFFNGKKTTMTYEFYVIKEKLAIMQREREQAKIHLFFRD
jgi:hypothetical protein